MIESDLSENRRTVARLVPRWFILYVLAPVAISRAVLIIAAWLGFHFLQVPLPKPKWEVASDGYVHPVSGHLSSNIHPFVNMWARWDAGWYLGIAEDGYTFAPGKPSNVGFFPLYPYLVRATHWVLALPGDIGWLYVGIIISNIALILALTYLYQLILLDSAQPIAARTVLYLCVFPMTLFLSAFYSESLFLAVVVAAFYYARTSRWFVAGILSAAAAMCRAPGVLLIVPLAFEYFSQREFRWRQIKPDLLALILPVAALAAHLIFLRWRFGEWNVMGKAELTQGWNRRLTFPWNTLWHSLPDIVSFRGFHGAFELIFTIVLVALTIFACFRLRTSYAIYAIVSLLFITSWGTLLSAPRLGIVIFPVIIALALLGENKVFHYCYLALSSMLAVVSMVVFSHWGWVS